MNLNLPQSVSAYFIADQGDSEGLCRCFTRDAVVKDEGHTYCGRPEIKQWKEDVSKKYQYTCEPLNCEEHDGRTVVTCRLEGNFPGSPVNLRFFFELEGDKVASLEVIP